METVGLSDICPPIRHRVHHFLAHPGGGAERYIDMLASIPQLIHDRTFYSSTRSTLPALLSIALRRRYSNRLGRNADIIHAHGDFAAALCLPLLRAKPSVWTPHGLHLLRRLRGIPKPLAIARVRAIVNATGATLCCSFAERAHLVGLIGDHPKLRVVRNGVAPFPPPDTLQRNIVRKDLGLEIDDIMLLYVGELEGRKGTLEVVAAARRAKSMGAPVTLFLAGGGKLARKLLSIGDEVIRPLGFRKDVVRLMAAADIFVMPSHIEGLSFALLEAMAHGLAIIATDEPSNSEAVGSTGVVVPIGDVGSFAAAIKRLAGSREERDMLGIFARRRAEDIFRAEALVHGVATAYGDVLRSTEIGLPLTPYGSQ